MQEPEAAEPIEEIPDGGEVTRIFFRLPLGMAEESEFPFMYDGDRDEKAESVYWRKYAVLIADVHERGRAIATKIGREYLGARTTSAARVRSLKSGRGHGFQVVHYPQGGDRAHAHIAIVRQGGNVKKLSTNDRLELTYILIECLKTCPFDAPDGES